MKVFIITQEDEDGKTILSVHLNENIANKVADKAIEDNDYCTIDVEEFEVQP
jgi:hypothetical protein